MAGQIEHIWNQLGDSAWGVQLSQRFRESLESFGSKLSGCVPGIAVSILGLSGSFVLIIAVPVFLSLSPDVYLEGFLRILPSPCRDQARRIAIRVASTLQSWLLGQIADMVIVALLVGSGLLLLGVPLAATLALIAGILNFIPYVGAIAGAIPSVLVALSVSPSLAL